MNLLDLAQTTGISLKKAAGTHGGEYHGPCPGCGGEDRFHVWPAQNNGEGSFWCRGCDKGGDAVTFLMEFKGLDFKEAMAQLDRPLEQRPRYRAPEIKKDKQEQEYLLDENKERIPPKEPWQQKAAALVEWAHEHLLANNRQISWLKSRGIDRKTIRHFQLGWNPGDHGKDLWRPRESWGLETIIKNNGRKKALWIPRGLVIPLIQDEQVLRVRIRRPGTDEPRYYVMPGSAMDQLVINPEASALTIVEAELDATSVFAQAGDLTGIIAMGSSSAKPYKKAFAALRAARAILIALDYDDAGSSAAQWWAHHFPDSERWPVPKGKDPGEAFQLGVDLRQWIISGLPPGLRPVGPLDKRWRKRKRGAVEGNGQKEKGPQEQGAKGAGQKELFKANSPIAELAAILREHPVAIHVSAERTHIREPQSWVRDNWGVASRLSELVFMDPEVFDFLSRHSEQLITGDNMFVGLGDEQSG